MPKIFSQSDPSSKLTLDNDVHPTKAPASIVSTDEGIVIPTRLVHPEKAPKVEAEYPLPTEIPLIFFKCEFLAKIIDVIPHPIKAPALISSIEDDMVRLVRDEQKQNAPLIPEREDDIPPMIFKFLDFEKTPSQYVV